MMKNRNLEHSDNWATPKELYDKLDAEFHFDFDPCPLNTGEITPDKDGLMIEWGQRNFVNPPYSRKLKEAFVKLAIDYAKQGRLCVMLLPVSTSTALFHDFIQPNAAEIRFLRGRVAFEGVNTFGIKVGKGSAPMHDSMIVVFKNAKKMKRVQIESPFAGDVQANIEYARMCLRDSLLRGEAPYASHLLYTQKGVLDDLKPEERKHGIEAGFEYMESSSLVAIYMDMGMSGGMKMAIENAKKLGKPVEFRSILNKETT